MAVAVVITTVVVSITVVVVAATARQGLLRVVTAALPASPFAETPTRRRREMAICIMLANTAYIRSAIIADAVARWML